MGDKEEEGAELKRVHMCAQASKCGYIWRSLLTTAAATAQRSGNDHLQDDVSVIGTGARHNDRLLRHERNLQLCPLMGTVVTATTSVQGLLALRSRQKQWKGRREKGGGVGWTRGGGRERGRTRSKC